MEEKTASPQSVQTLVVGAGVIGCSAALFLRRRGREVLLVDRDLPGRGASGRNPGSLAVQNKPVVLAPAAMESIRVWQEFQALDGYDMGYHLTGGFRLAETPEEVERLRAIAVEQREVGATIEHLSGRAITDMAPYLTLDRVLAANYCPGDGYGNPLVAVPDLVRAFTDLGGVVQPWTQVYALEDAGPGVRARTSRGDIRAREVVVAAGVFAPALLATVGCSVPVGPRAMQLMVTEPVAHFIPHMLTHVNGNLTLKQKSPDGNILIGGGLPAVQLDPNSYQAHPMLGNLIDNAHSAARVIPNLREVKVIRTWGGVDGRTPDLMPIFGRVPAHPQVWYSTSCTGGYTIGPLLGRSLAEAMDGETVHESVRAYLCV